MRRILFSLLLGLAAGAGSLAATAPADTEIVRAVEKWRGERVGRLTAPDGWLSLIGLHFLQPGPNRVGSAADNDIVLAKGPARLGTATFAADGQITLELAAGAAATYEDAPFTKTVLRPEQGTTPGALVKFGTVSLYALERGGKMALRVKDSASPRLTGFLGIDYFPIDPRWVLAATWVPYEKARFVPYTNSRGQPDRALVPGKAVFTYQGQTYEIEPHDDGPGTRPYFVLSDTTSGTETYGAARFLYIDRPAGGPLVLDFNRMQNPPCAFTPFAACPLPAKGNRLPFPVRAGEKRYRGEEH
ncbi:MAG: hypothetical protein B9S34_06685 [Opitutia bacterium Tous-C1TDCM]|nr:MAG: hypothetical protein B9S34_06685 [Opitutae bacterium Tous-C1TDCM]